MEDLFGMKELYDVVLKATYNIDIDGKTYVPGEVIAAFDKIMISNFTTRKKYSFARGGKGNMSLISWETTEDIVFNFDQGVFSKTQLALLSNSKLLKEESEVVQLSYMEDDLTTNADGEITLKYTPLETEFFIYNKDTGVKISSYTIDGNVVTIATALLDVIVRYKFEYSDGYSIMNLGQALTDGFLELEGKTKLTSNYDNLVTTGILTIPRLKLMSNLVLRLGENALPQVMSFSGVGFPVGDKRDKYVCSMIYLNSDIDADIL